MPLTLDVPLHDGRYRRRFEASIDVPEAGRLLVRGRTSDGLADLEHSWRLSTPQYEVLAATARQHAGDAARVAPALCGRYAAIAGTRIGRGFSKRILEALGSDLPGAQAHLLLAIDLARVGQQVFQLPPEFDERFPVEFAGPSGAAMATWNRDRAYMPGLANSCHTYSDASATAFRERAIVCNFGEDLARPPPGSTGVFRRHKQLAVQASGDGFLCECAMQDNLHDIAVRFTLGADGRVSSPSSTASRLPWRGLCESPQARVAGLEGLRVTRAFIEQFAERVGGPQGCTHLFDLSVDCLRLFRFPD